MKTIESTPVQEAMDDLLLKLDNLFLEAEKTEEETDMDEFPWEYLYDVRDAADKVRFEMKLEDIDKPRHKDFHNGP